MSKPRRAARVREEVALPLPREFLDRPCPDRQVVAYLSVKAATIFVRGGEQARALEALKARREGDGWRVRGSREVFQVVKTRARLDQEGDGKGGKAPRPPDVPTPGDRRVKLDCECGPRQALRSGRCRKLKDDLYARAVFFARALCRAAPGKMCTETYLPYAEGRLYRDANCTDFIGKSVEFGWLCAGGPPKYL